VLFVTRRATRQALFAEELGTGLLLTTEAVISRIPDQQQNGAMSASGMDGSAY